MKDVAKQIKMNSLIVLKRRNFLSQIMKHPVHATNKYICEVVKSINLYSNASQPMNSNGITSAKFK